MAVDPAGARGVEAVFVGPVRPLLGQVDAEHFIGAGRAGVEEVDPPQAAAGGILVGEIRRQMGLFAAAGALRIEELAVPVRRAGVVQFVDAQQGGRRQQPERHVRQDQLAEAQAARAHGRQFGVLAQLPQRVKQRQQQGNRQQVGPIGRQQPDVVGDDVGERRAGVHEIDEIAEQIDQDRHQRKTGHDVDPRPAQMAEQIAADQLHRLRPAAGREAPPEILTGPARLLRAGIWFCRPR